MELALLYKSLIDSIVAAAGSAALLHVHAGLTIYLLTMLAVRRRGGGLIGVQMVAIAEAINETLDWMAGSPRWSVADTVSDVVLTLMWPIAITAVGRFRRQRWQRQAAPVSFGTRMISSSTTV